MTTDTRAITSFIGQYRFLSNFFRHPVQYGLTWPSAEHAFQAEKTIDPIQRNWVFEADTSREAKRRGLQVTLRSDWEDIKLSVMRDIVHAKFQDPELRAMLLDTGNAVLIEGNDWGDTYWGVCRGVGANHLGRILMDVRERLRQAGP